MIACTAAYSMMRNFAPDNLTLFNVYLFMLGLLIVPKVVFTLSSLAGLAVKRLLKLRTNWGNHTGLVLVLGWFYVLFMGTMVGPDQLHVKRVTLEFDSLPKAIPMPFSSHSRRSRDCQARRRYRQPDADEPTWAHDAPTPVGAYSVSRL